MAQAYFSLVTNTGKIKIAQSAAGGDPVVITHFAIGDGNGAETNPTAAATALVREVWRTPVESVITDPDNPSAILVTAIIPTNAGGWWMREFGIFDQAGSMIAVAKPVSQYKPTALEGQLEDIRYEFQLIIGENANVTLLVDPSLLFATRAWVENRKVPMGQLLRLPWLPVISMTLSSAPGNPTLGDSYLIPSNATGAWAANIGALAEWNGSAWNYVAPPDGHGISLPDGRVFERIAGVYVQKMALDAQSGKWNYAVTGGTTAAMTADISPAPASLGDGLSIVVRPSVVPATGCTLDLNSLGARPLIWSDGTPFKRGQAAINVPLRLTYSTFLAGWVINSIKTAVSPWFILSGTPAAIPTNINAALTNWPSLASGGVTGTISQVSGRFTVGVDDAGTWVFTAGSNTQGESSQECAMIVKNDVVVDLVGLQSTSPLAGLDASLTTVMRVAAGDVLYAAYFQNSGGWQSMNSIGTSKFTGAKIGA